jgi:flagellar FliL protein
MATTAAAVPADAPAAKADAGGRRKLLVIAIPLALAALGAGLWFGGVIPRLLGLGEAAKPAGETAAGDKGHGDKAAGPSYVAVPDIIANLDNGGRRPVYVKLRVRIELAKPEDQAAVEAAMPRIQDLFQTYLREMRPEELRGSAGTYRLREELIARANIAVAPARIQDLLFVEMLIQ